MRSKVLCVTNILASAYAIYLIVYFFGSTVSASGTEAIGGAIATALVMPHMLMFLIGAVFGWLGFFIKKAGLRSLREFYMRLAHCFSLHILCLAFRC